MDRRKFSQMVALTGAAGLMGRSMPARSQVRQIRIVNSGGASADAAAAAYGKPFTSKTGIQVVTEGPNLLGKLRALVETGNSSTTLFVLGAMAFEQAKSLNLIRKLDWQKIDPMPMFPETRNDYGLGFIFYSTLMAWRKGQRAPNDWAQFFNSQDFPGKRALPDNPIYVLPAALLAAGVPMEKLYPLDVDLAFQKLSVFKKDVSIWWKSGVQPPQLLRDNEVQYAMAWSGRANGQEGVEYSFNQASLDISFMVVVRTAVDAEVDAAYKYLHEMTVAENQAIYYGIDPYPGNSPSLEKLLPPEAVKKFETAANNKSVQYYHDAKWWYTQGDAVERRWQQFKLSL